MWAVEKPVLEIMNATTLPPRTVAEATDKSGLFNFDKAEFMYEPFPVGLIRPVLDQAFYDELVATFPDISLFKEMPYLGNKASRKWSLAEMNNGENYERFLNATPCWKRFHDWVKSPEFLIQTVEFLNRNDIALGYLRKDKYRRISLLHKLQNALNKWRYGHDIPLKARFEFSVMPADGGQLHPHTDSPWKIITYVVTMTKPGEWNPAFGGGTDILRPKKPEHSFNWLNGYLEYSDCEVLHTYEFEPNQALLFFKTFNSWHCVQPIKGGNSGLLRRTLTIDIEKFGRIDPALRTACRLPIVCDSDFSQCTLLSPFFNFLKGAVTFQDMLSPMSFKDLFSSSISWSLSLFLS